jgi:hypothetical protein
MIRQFREVLGEKNVDLTVRTFDKELSQAILLSMRNVQSPTVLRESGLPSELGADIAWTFELHPPEYGRRMCDRRVGTRRVARRSSVLIIRSGGL